MYWGVSGDWFWAFTQTLCAHRPRCSVLRELSETIEISVACQPGSSTFFEAFETTQTALNVKTTGRPEIESRSPKLLVATKNLSPLKLCCSGLGLGAVGPGLDASRSSYSRGQTLGLRSGLPSTPTSIFRRGSGAKHLNLVLIQSTAGRARMQITLNSIRLRSSCNSVTLAATT